MSSYLCGATVVKVIHEFQDREAPTGKAKHKDDQE